MAPTAVRSRHRVLRETTGSAPASDGFVTLYSQHLPQLPPDKYEIKVVHDFVIPMPKLPGMLTTPPDFSTQLVETRKLEVRFPQFSLDHGAVHSVYPPPGAEVSGGVLPHAVFHDPYLPWARKLKNPTGGPAMPWLCLMAFDPAELMVTPDELLGPKGARPSGGLFPSAKSETELPFSSSSYTLDTTLETLQSKGYKPQTPFGDNGIDTEGLDKKTAISVILPRRSVLEQLFPWSAPGDHFYRYMAHARELDASSFADVLGVTDGDATTGLSTYGVMISPRCGPINNKQSQTVVVHVVSLESVAGLYGTAASEFSDRVALVSLYSWTYSCTPPMSVDFLDSARNLGNGMQRLRAPDKITRGLSAPIDESETGPVLPGNQAQKAWLSARLEDGFTFVRHRLANGEATSGMYRSVLTPNLVQHPLREGDEGEMFPTSSRYGTDLQIIDSQTGLADLTYNLAWELGKSLGTGDKTFSAALLRVRNAIHAIAIKEASETVLSHKKSFVNREQILRDLGHLASRLHPATGPNQKYPRWACGADKCGVATARSSLRFSEGAMKAALEKSVVSAAAQVASRVDGGVYTEKGAPKNTDWAVVLSWVMDKLFLGDIPPQYILPDPSHLPRESLRTFHIDDNWMDCLLDGALSIADRFDQHDGGIRDAIKVQINRFLKTKDKSGEYPAVPSWGFLMRSAIVGAFPNLEIKAAMPDGSAMPLSGSDLCISNVISEDILMCVFNRGMSTREQYHEGFVIAQPKHQQHYAVGTDVEADRIQIIFTPAPDPYNSTSAASAASDASCTGLWERGGRTQLPYLENKPSSEQPPSIPGAEKVFDFDTRTLQFPGFVKTAAAVYANLLNGPGRTPQDSTQVTAALVAHMLSQPTLKMTLEDRQVAAETGELPYRELLARHRAPSAASASRAAAVTAPVKRQLPLKRPPGTAAAGTSRAAVTQAALPVSSPAVATPEITAASSVQSASASAASAPSDEVRKLLSEQFSPKFQFPTRLLSLEAESVSQRGWGVSWFNESRRNIFVPRPLYEGTSVARAALIVTPLQPAPRTVALNSLELRIPVGPIIEGRRGTLFDHTLREETRMRPPQPRVVGPRWLCHATYEVPAYNDDGWALGGDQLWYVIKIVPRVGVDSLFGWQLSEMGGIEVVLPELELRPAALPQRKMTFPGSIRKGSPVVALEEVIVTAVQQFTWEERVAWEIIGSRTEKISLWKLIHMTG